MSRTARKVLFYSMILVFLLGGTWAALFAQGLVFDFSAFHWEKVGGIYVRSVPGDAGISLDGKAVKNTNGFFERGTLIGDLFPKKYALTLTAPGFRDWKEAVEVKPALVTEAKYAVLVPTSSTLVVSGSPRNFWVLSNQIVIEDATGTLALQDRKLPGNEVVGWTTDETHFLTLNTKSGAYFWNDLRNATSVPLAAGLKKIGIRTSELTLAVDPENTTQVVAWASTTLALVDPVKQQVSQIASSTIPSSPGYEITAVAASRFWLAWALYNKKTDASQIYFYDKFFGGVRAVGDPVHGRTIKLAWANNNILGFFEDDGEFYTFTPGTAAPQHIASDVHDFVFTPSGNRVVTLGHVDLEIFTLNDLSDPEQYWRIHLPQTKRITGLAWYGDDAHLFVSYPGTTGFLELSDLNLDNFQVLSNTDKVYYDRPANQFFYLENGELRRIDFPQ